MLCTIRVLHSNLTRNFVQDPIRQRIAFSWLLSLFGGGDGGDGGDGDDDRFSWNFRPFANLPNQQPFNYNWPAVPTSTLG